MAGKCKAFFTYFFNSFIPTPNFFVRKHTRIYMFKKILGIEQNMTYVLKFKNKTLHP